MVDLTGLSLCGECFALGFFGSVVSPEVESRTHLVGNLWFAKFKAWIRERCDEIVREQKSGLKSLWFWVIL